jgi:hypothetical protein
MKNYDGEMKPHKATPKKTLRRRLKSVHYPKSEIEWYAKRRIEELEGAIRACRDTNDNGEGYNSPTADSAQCLANLFSLVENE